MITSFTEWSCETVNSVERDRIETHLSTCRECGAYFEKMAAFMQSMHPSVLPELTADSHLPTRVRALARERGRPDGVADSVRSFTRPRRLADWLRLSVAGAAAALAITIGIYVGYGAGVTMSRSNTAAQVPEDESSDALDLYYTALSQTGFADAWSRWEGDGQP